MTLDVKAMHGGERFELKLCSEIEKWNNYGIEVAHQGRNVKSSDINVNIDGIGSAFIEAKKAKDASLVHTRFFYRDEIWQSTYQTPIAKYGIDNLNASETAKEFIEELKKFVGRSEISLAQRLLSDCVKPDEMRKFCSTRLQNLFKNENVDVANMLREHHTKGKIPGGNYLQLGDNFYVLINDPLKFNNVCDPEVPVYEAVGHTAVRIMNRSKKYEIIFEMKDHSSQPSPYSVFAGANKINPFETLAGVLGEIDDRL
jgi:hypothetical protein